MDKTYSRMKKVSSLPYRIMNVLYVFSSTLESLVKNYMCATLEPISHEWVHSGEMYSA